MAEVHPGATNVYTPAFAQGAASDQLVVEYSRKPDSFALNRYASLMPVSLSSGYYMRVSTEDAIRVVTPQDYEWPESNDRPRGKTRKHEFVQYTTRRYAEGFTVGRKTAEQATFDVIATHARGAATTMMTLRSINAVSTLTATGNWGANDVADVTTLLTSTDHWGTAGTTAADNGVIQDSFQTISRTIHQGTGGVVGPKDLVCVISPTVAHAMRISQEMRAYVVNNESSLPYWMGTEIFQTYGLPPAIYGIEIVVEDAVRESAREGATSSVAYALGNSAVFLARPGGQMLPDNSAEAFTLSTLTGFFYEEMSVELKEDEWQRRNEGSVVDDYVYEITNSASGYLIVDVLA